MRNDFPAEWKSLSHVKEHCEIEKLRLIRLADGPPGEPWQQAWQGISAETISIVPMSERLELYEIEVGRILERPIAEAKAYLRDLRINTRIIESEESIPTKATVLSVAAPSHDRKEWFPILRFDYHIISDFVYFEKGYLFDDTALYLSTSEDPLGEP